MAPTVTVPAGYDTDATILKSELKIYLGTGLIISNIKQPDMGTDTGVITASAGAPATTLDGRAWWHLTPVTNGPSKYLTVYHAGLTRDMTPPANAMPWASLPATATTGERIYVSDLQITVEWHEAADDALLTGGAGLAGWHPVAAGLALVSNVSGADIEVGRLVALVGTTATRNVTKTTLVKQQNLFGVALHTFATATNGIIATPAYGRPVKVFCNGAVRAILAGEVMAASATAGVAQSCGPSPAAPYGAAATRTAGMPLGSFAQAMTDSVADELVTCRLLGAVGGGCTVLMAFGNPTNPIDAQTGVGTTGTITSDIVGLLLNAKHAPCVAALLSARYTLEGGLSAIITINGLAESMTHVTTAGNPAQWRYRTVAALSDVGAAPTTLGTQFTHALSVIAGGNTIGADYDVHGYVY